MASRYSALHLNAYFAFATSIVLLSHPASLRGQEPDPAAPTPPESVITDLTLTGGDEILWLSRGWIDPAEKTPLNAFAFQKKGAPNPLPLIITPQIGEIRRTAVMGDGLHVFLGPRDRDAVHQRYSPDGPRREQRLPGFEVPVAMTGGMHDKRPMIWAIVTRATRTRVAAEWADRQGRSPTQPAEAAAPKDAPDKTEKSGNSLVPGPEQEEGWALVLYDGRTWQPGELLPDAGRDVDNFLLCRSREGVIHLFWKDLEDPRRLIHYEQVDGAWTRRRSIELDAEPHALMAAVLNRQLILASLVPVDEAGQYRCETRIVHSESSSPAASQPLLNSEGESLIVGDQARMAAFGDNLALLYVSGGNLRIGLWPPSGGKPVRPPEIVTIRPYTLESQSESGIKDFAVTLIVAALVLLLLWRRQESISQPAPLPPGVMIAGVGKRVLAGLLDMLPALGISLSIWWSRITPYFEMVYESSQIGYPVDPNLIAKPAAVIWWWVTFRVIYVFHCILFEAITSTTPGKRVLGCRVVTENVERPNIVQIIIRNVTRYLELEPGIVLFLLVVFLTRNRQRIGDLLAKTLVIEGRHIPMAGTIEMDDSLAARSSDEQHQSTKDTEGSDHKPPDA